MNRNRLFPLILPLFLAACAAPVKQQREGTIAQLRNQRIEIKGVEVKGGFEEAMESYQRFLEESRDSTLAPEAMRRLADLKIEKEYGRLTGEDESADKTAGKAKDKEEKAKSLPAPATQQIVAPAKQESASKTVGKGKSETDAEFEKRAAGTIPVVGQNANQGEPTGGGDDLERPGALEAVALYQKLLKKYPLYERNDQVLYQMSRAYEELGRTKEAMKVMDRLVKEYPNSRYIDEVQFRRAEYFFVHRHYLDAEDAYKSIVDMGVSSFYYQLALYKLGWTYYKQELYGEALDRFIALLDYEVSVGYDFDQTKNEIESKRTEDTFRVISLSFSYLGGAKAVVDYFSKHGKRSYEDRVYSNLAEYYFDKRRFSDATATYDSFVSRNPFHEKAPIFQMRVIQINIAGGFPSLVIESKKAFATNYGLKSAYWQHFEPSARPKVMGFLKTNLKDLADYYHALYQNKKQAKEKAQNFTEALHWYHEYIASFPGKIETAAINYQLASLLLENRSFAEAALQFEKTAYDYPRHEKSSEAGYAAVYAYRQYLGEAPATEKEKIRKEVVRTSLKFADTYPEHKKAAIVLGAAADDLDDMEDYARAQAAGRKLIEKFPTADKDIVRGAWLVVAHSSFELKQYSDAENGYGQVLALLPEGDKSRSEMVDNLAISIYKQGEEAKARKDYRAAADYFLRVGVKAPTSKYVADADYDAATALIILKDWKTAATVLNGFRQKYPGNKLQPEVTKKIAYVYQEDGKLALAADEYERIERESGDEAVKREALLTAGELHEKVGNNERALAVYRRYVGYFPHPVEPNLETRNKICLILKAENAQKDYLAELGQIVAIEAAAGDERTPGTRSLAGEAALVLAQRSFDEFAAVKLVKPFDVNLRLKKKMMKKATQEFNKLFDYELGDVTAASTYYLAEIFENFSKSLTNSERPEGLSPLELEQYNLAIEDQAYPFEEKAISVHERNLKLISRGIYNKWIDKSLRKLAILVPARYDRPEEESETIASLDTYMFAYGKPRSVAQPGEAVATGGAGVPAKTGTTEKAAGTEVKVEQSPVGQLGQATAQATTGEQAQVEKPSQAQKTGLAGESAQSGQAPQEQNTAANGEPAEAGKTLKASVPETTEPPEQAENPAQPKNAEATGEPAQSSQTAHKQEAGANGETAETGSTIKASVSETTGVPAQTVKPAQPMKVKTTGELAQSSPAGQEQKAAANGVTNETGSTIKTSVPEASSTPAQAEKPAQPKKVEATGESAQSNQTAPEQKTEANEEPAKGGSTIKTSVQKTTKSQAQAEKQEQPKKAGATGEPAQSSQTAHRQGAGANGETAETGSTIKASVPEASATTVQVEKPAQPKKAEATGEPTQSNQTAPEQKTAVTGEPAKAEGTIKSSVPETTETSAQTEKLAQPKKAEAATGKSAQSEEASQAKGAEATKPSREGEVETVHATEPVKHAPPAAAAL